MQPPATASVHRWLMCIGLRECGQWATSNRESKGDPLANLSCSFVHMNLKLVVVGETDIQHGMSRTLPDT